MMTGYQHYVAAIWIELRIHEPYYRESCESFEGAGEFWKHWFMDFLE